jgi:hypothetical protein
MLKLRVFRHSLLITFRCAKRRTSGADEASGFRAAKTTECTGKKPGANEVSGFRAAKTTEPIFLNK